MITLLTIYGVLYLISLAGMLYLCFTDTAFNEYSNGVNIGGSIFVSFALIGLIVWYRVVRYGQPRPR